MAMGNADIEIEEKIKQLTPEMKQEILDFIEFLLNKKKEREKRRKTFSFCWAGTLSHLKEKITSVELQHKALEWW